MTNIIQADIFFFISSIATVALTIFLFIIGYYIVLIVRDAKYISGKLRDATDGLEESIVTIREKISEEKNKAKHILDFFHYWFFGKNKSKTKSSTRKKYDSEDVVE